ncbi:MAG: hypothetical protein GX050_02045 [Firmicutes bacterium]|nr:hypothetical protein [Bacillota bacterium]
MALGFFFLGFLLTKLVVKFIEKLLRKAGMVKQNYRAETVPAALGLVFPLVFPLLAMLPQFLKLLGLTVGFTPGEFFAFLFYTTGFGLLGLADDLLKNDDEKGLQGHLSLLRHGELTSGGLKALFGLFFSIIFAVGIGFTQREEWWLLFPRILLGALAPNILNLFDLRPGRALKVFLGGLIIFLPVFLLTKKDTSTLYLIFLLLGSVVAYFPYDLQARGMLGDTGANYLGAVLAGLVILERNTIVLLLLLLIFITLQLIAEKISFTKLIEKNAVLKFIDDLGRE